MKASHYIAIGVRLFSVFIFIVAFRRILLLPEVLIYGTIDGIGASISFMIISAIVPTIIATALWLFPSKTANFIVRKEIDNDITPINPLEFSIVIVAGLGLYLLYFSISDSIYWLTVFNVSEPNSYASNGSGIGGQSKAAIIATSLEIVMSLTLILKSKTISRLIFKVAK